jgi:hypothetical protein
MKIWWKIASKSVANGARSVFFKLDCEAKAPQLFISYITKI